MTSPSAPWHEHFCACQPNLIRFLARQTGDLDEARELAQETWLRVAESALAEASPDTLSPEAARCYFFTTAARLALDRLRGRRRQARYLIEAAAADPVLDHDVAERIMYQQALSEVDGAIARLPSRAREAFVAHRLDGEKQVAIAERLGVSVNLVERDLGHASDRIEAALHRWRGSARDEIERGRAGRSRRRSLGRLLTLIGLSASGLGAWQLSQWWQARLQWQSTVLSRTGQRLRRALPDGSELALDAASELRLRYFASRREAQLLAGAVYLDIAPDPGRPFVIAAGTVQIIVLGTRLGIERLDDAVIVQVEHGRVRVSGSAAQRELVAGDSLIVVHDTAGRTEWRQGRVNEAAGWRRGELAFDQQALGWVIARLQRYTPRRLDIEPAAGALIVSGHLRIAEADQWLRALPGSAPVRLLPLPDGGLSIERR